MGRDQRRARQYGNHAMKLSAETFPYERAPSNAKDIFWTTDYATIYWTNPPDWAWQSVRSSVRTEDGVIWRESTMAGECRICVCLDPHFAFSVSVAPDVPSATVPSSVHDWIYGHADKLSVAWCCSIKSVLRLADHWFLALMRTTRFPFKRTYFLGVSLFGYAFNRLGAWWRR